MQDDLIKTVTAFLLSEDAPKQQIIEASVPSLNWKNLESEEILSLLDKAASELNKKYQKNITDEIDSAFDEFEDAHKNLVNAFEDSNMLGSGTAKVPSINWKNLKSKEILSLMDKAASELEKKYQDTDISYRMFNKLTNAIKKLVAAFKVINEASGQSDPDITVWTKKGKHNYDSFLAANEDRIGKPMINGGLKATRANADVVNGKPVEDMIYCGAGCVVYKDGAKIRFIKLPSDLINTGDGSMPWSKYSSFSSEGVLIKADKKEQFEAIAKAVQKAATKI
jgi:hypothetical protein